MKSDTSFLSDKIVVQTVTQLPRDCIAWGNRRIKLKKELMKNCPKCNSELEDSFEICWNCNYTLPEDTDKESADDSQSKNEVKIECLRCKVPLAFSGNYNFQTVLNLGFFNNRESFDLYICPKCRKVEFFSPEEDE